MKENIKKWKHKNLPNGIYSIDTYLKTEPSQIKVCVDNHLESIKNNKILDEDYNLYNCIEEMKNKFPAILEFIQFIIEEKDIILEYKNKSYTEKQLQEIIDRNEKMQFYGEEGYCPLCDCDLEENGLFVCGECGELLELDEMCTEHYDGSDNVCRDCCDDCRSEEMQSYMINQEIDIARGK